MLRTDTKRIYLVGYRGAGKSTIGPLLAKSLTWSFVDCDREVEKMCGQTVKELFDSGGEPLFRAMESELLSKYAQLNNVVVAWGGGIVLAPNSIRRLKDGWCVWLQASPGTLWSRLQADTENPRPALTTLTGIDEVQKVLADRTPLYQQVADLVVSTENRSPEQVVTDILTAC